MELSLEDKFSQITQVSRETIISLKSYEKELIKSNKELNLVGKSTINHIWDRHFLDSSQAIDFIDKNKKKLVDIGSGAGFPGLIIAIIAKDRKIDLKIDLIEKSPKKCNFLRKIIKSLKINATIINQNVFDLEEKINADIVIARAFKPLKVILELIEQKIDNNSSTLLFLGKTWKKELVEASKLWDLQYKQSVSITNSDSVVVHINKIKRK